MKACQHCLGAGMVAVEREYGPGNRRCRNADVEWIDVECEVCEGAGTIADDFNDGQGDE